MSRRAVPKANGAAARCAKACLSSRRAVPKANGAAVRCAKVVS